MVVVGALVFFLFDRHAIYIPGIQTNLSLHDMMLQRWQKKRTHFPLISLLLFFAFIIATLFFTEHHIQHIHQSHSSSNHHLDDLQIVSLNQLLFNSTPHNSPSVPLDVSTKCNSTVSYSGRRPEWNIHTPELDYRTESAESCDLFSGKWIFDNTSHPLYNELDCPYMSDQLACHKHGRPDLEYQRWRWQPNNCNLKRWNATEIWEKLRGKRLMYVGDSLNRGQWISMLCLLQSVIPSNKKSITPQAHLTTFRAEDYNATVEFLWAPLLVESNSDDPVNHRLDERIIRPDSLLRHSTEWEQADILVFNSYLWWRAGPIKILWSGEKNGVCEKIEEARGMELAMEAWGNWVASNVDSLEKKVFFVTMSPTHQLSNEWKPRSEGNCYGEKMPIEDEGYWGSGSDLATMRVVDKVLNRLGSKVTALNITQLSEYRKDGHPSIYRKFWEERTPEQLANPSSYSDCIHWCLPGVGDVWNELLFQFL